MAKINFSGTTQIDGEEVSVLNVKLRAINESRAKFKARNRVLSRFPFQIEDIEILNIDVIRELGALTSIYEVRVAVPMRERHKLLLL